MVLEDLLPALALALAERLVARRPQDQRGVVAHRAEAALDELSPRDREALLLWDSGLSYEEIAAQTGLARGAIGTTLSRARRRLVQAYEAGKPGEHVARG